jgi:hypothetical protein
MRTSTRIKILVASLCALMAASVATAPAGDFTDPDDMTSPLDVRELVFTPARGSGGTLKLTTDDRWDCEYIQPQLNTMTWNFDGRADGDTDLVGRVRCVDGDLLLFLRGRSSGNRYEPVPGSRPNRKSVKFRFSFDLPELNGRHLGLSIDISDGAAEGCTSANACHDRAPDRGRWQLY